MTIINTPILEGKKVNNKKKWTPPMAGTRVRFVDGVEGEVRYFNGLPEVFLREQLQIRKVEEEGEGATNNVLHWGWTRCEPAPISIEQTLDRRAKIRRFYYKCLEGTGGKIKETLTEADLKYWGDAMVAVEKNYVGRGRKPIATMYVSPFYTFADTDRCEINPSLYPMDNAEVQRRRRIRYLRNLCCKNQSTSHLTEAGWAFWEKVMRNTDAEFAPPMSTSKRYTEFLRSFISPRIVSDCAKATAADHAKACSPTTDAKPPIGRDSHFIGVDHAKGPSKTVVSYWVSRESFEALQSENEILRGKVKAAETRRVEMQTKINKVSNMFLDAQHHVRMTLEDISGWLIRSDAKSSGAKHLANLREIAILKLPE